VCGVCGGMVVVMASNEDGEVVWEREARPQAPGRPVPGAGAGANTGQSQSTKQIDFLLYCLYGLWHGGGARAWGGRQISNLMAQVE
jgi:hypothetical protein